MFLPLPMVCTLSLSTGFQTFSCYVSLGVYVIYFRGLLVYIPMENQFFTFPCMFLMGLFKVVCQKFILNDFLLLTSSCKSRQYRYLRAWAHQSFDFAALLGVTYDLLSYTFVKAESVFVKNSHFTRCDRKLDRDGWVVRITMDTHYDYVKGLA